MRNTMRTLLVTMAAAALAGVGAPAAAQQVDQETGVEVTRAVVATGVEDREPIGDATEFGADVGRVVFYTIFEGDFPEQQFEHVWLHEGEEVARVTLTARGPRWRTWSSKEIPVDATGSWSVRVEDANGTELRTVDFTIGG